MRSNKLYLKVIFGILLSGLVYSPNAGAAGSYAYIFTGQLIGDGDHGHHHDCSIFSNPLLYQSFTVGFTIPRDAEPDGFIPFNSSVYVVDGSDVDFYVGKSEYQVEKIVVGIGMDFISVSIPEFDALRMEFHWPQGSFSPNNPSALCEMDSTTHKKMRLPEMMYAFWVNETCAGNIDTPDLIADCIPLYSPVEKDGSGSNEPYPYIPGTSNPPVDKVFGKITKPSNFNITPRELKYRSHDRIDDYLGYDLSDSWLDNKLDLAGRQVEKSLESWLWLDNETLTDKGHQVFIHSRNAVNTLGQIIDRYASSAPQVDIAAMESILLLVRADLLLAQIAYDNAMDIADLSSSKVMGYLESAAHEIEMGIMESESGNYEKAIQHYRQAWEHSERAVTL